MGHRSRASRVVRFVHHLVFDASRAGRSSEIAAWSNAFASLAIGAGAFALARSWPIGFGAFVLAFALLRASLAHRLTVWIAASLGTLAVGALGGGLTWLFAHVIDMPSAPSIAAVLGAIGSSLAPAWAYANLAQRRADDVRDSLIHPVSVPPSRN